MKIEAVGIGLPAEIIQGTERRRDDPAKIKDAARQFEALLIGQIMKEFAATNRSGLFSDDESNGAVMEMGSEQLAQSLAARGGFGIAQLLTHGLKADAQR